MLKICNLKECKQYIDEVAILEYNEWATNPKQNYEKRIKSKKEKMLNQLDTNEIYKLILLNDKELVGFISIFSKDSEEFLNLSPWYSTMYVKKEYRVNGYSKILNDAILKEAKMMNIKCLYLKTNLINYYERFGAVYIQDIKDGEKLYKFDIKKL